MKKLFDIEHFFLNVIFLLLLLLASSLIRCEDFESVSFYLLTFLCSYLLIIVGCSNNKIILFWVGLSFLASIMAFRDQIGIDDEVYKKMFLGAGGKNIIKYFNSEGVERGYLLLNWLLHYVFNANYNLAQVCITLITFLIWGKALLSNKFDFVSIPTMFLFLWSHYFFLVLCSGLVRIFIAIPIALYSLQFVWNNNLKKFLITIAIASLFHMSSLSMLLLLPFLIWPEIFYKRWYVYVGLLSFIIVVSFGLVATYLVPLLGSRYLKYGEIGVLKMSVGNFDTLPIWFMGLYYIKKINFFNNTIYKRYILGMFLLSLSMIFSVASSIVPLGRLIFYANLGILLVLSTIFKKQSTSIIDFLSKIIIILYSVIYVFYTIFMNEELNLYIIPYKYFFDN